MYQSACDKKKSCKMIENTANFCEKFGKGDE